MKKYTKEFLIDEFWRFYKENNRYPLGKDMKAKNGYPSQDAYQTHWGTFNKLLNELGIMGSNEWYKCDEKILIDMYLNYSQEDILDKLMVKRKWAAIKKKARDLGLNRGKEIRYASKTMSDDFLIRELKRFYNIYNKVPTATDFDSNSEYPTHKVYAKHFGSWNNALREAGMDVNLQFNNYTKEDMIRIGLEHYNNSGEIPLSHEMGFSYSVLNKYWDTWNDYLAEINLKSNKVNKYLREELIDKLFEFHNILGRRPKSQDFIDNKWYPCRATFEREFGGLIKACVVAGIMENPLSFKERIDISIKQLKTLAEQLNKCPTVDEYDSFNDKGLCRRELEKKLNLKYNDICKRYIPQYSVNNDKDITQEEIINTIKEIYNILGRPPMQKELKNFGCNYSFTIFDSKFNMTYNQLIRSLGWIPTGTDTIKRTEEEMLDDFYNYFKELKRVPTFYDLDKNKNIASSTTYISYFHSLDNICKLLNIDYSGYVGCGRICYDILGNLCKSYLEADISNYFINNNIKFDKEPRYSEFIPNCKKKFDWKIYIGDQIYYVEYFGMYNKKSKSKIVEKYVKRTKLKIKMLYKYKVIDKCIFIFPWDIKNKTLDEIFGIILHNEIVV
jgi:hypothetical protein